MRPHIEKREEPGEQFVLLSICEQRWLLSAHAWTVARFIGFSYFSQKTQIWAGKIDHPNFEGGLSFNRSSVSQVKGINIKKKLNVKTENHGSRFYGIFSVDKALLVDT